MLAIIGGSGLSKLVNMEVRRRKVARTPVVFLPRHGRFAIAILIHDRDSIFAKSLDESIERLGLKVLKSPLHSPMRSANA
jgi:hypothetical protein